MYQNSKLIPELLKTLKFVCNRPKNFKTPNLSRYRNNPHTSLKRNDLNRKYCLLGPLLGKNSKLTMFNKITIFNMILKPTWAYALEVWWSAKASNIFNFLTSSYFWKIHCGAAKLCSNNKFHPNLSFWGITPKYLYELNASVCCAL